MKRTIILHDLEDNVSLEVNKDKYTIFAHHEEVKPCVGCFSCWIKTPGKCIIPDKDSDFATVLPHHNEAIIISRMVFGGFSPNIKAIIDRSIGFMLPFFQILEGEMHHMQRYNERPDFKYMFYNDFISEAEKLTAQKLIKANALNFGMKNYEVCFFSTPAEILEVLK